jgi:hypothetical protein
MRRTWMALLLALLPTGAAADRVHPISTPLSREVLAVGRPRVDDLSPRRNH